MKTLTIKTQSPYMIYFADGLLQANIISDYCKKLANRTVIICDERLTETHAATLKNVLQANKIDTELFAFQAREENKTREAKQQLEDQLLEHQYGRDCVFIALGGGVTTDLVGFLAATFCRGVPVLYVPTTLLAMVDASIGGKCAVNTPFGKNLIGVFSQPQAVFIDPATLNTLPQVEFNNGMVELIKHSVIADEELFTTLLHQHELIKTRQKDLLIDLIYQSCVIKKTIVEADEKDFSKRQLLNFGHTIGHAIEALENHQIRHGEAVALGMLVEAYLSMQMGLFTNEALTTLKNILLHYQLPLQTQAFANIHAFHKVLAQDKKTINQIPHFVLLEKIGEAYINQNNYAHKIDAPLLLQALTWAEINFGTKP